ncbi:MAG: sugar nucleotide-binding protein [Gemmatimonadetes bacterium]|nr:sugar nucleotide-binding protein [Gemmatimonadota bacterium]
MTSPIFITGGSGLLGLNWAAHLRELGTVTLGLHRREVALSGTHSVPCDLDTVDAAMRTLAEAEPALVVHAAGLTSVEQCEADPQLARHVNVSLAANVARATARLGVPLIHVSTDHLYDGARPLADEETPLMPLNEYGRTKAQAEADVLEAHPDALVVRTNFYGWGTGYRHSFSDTVIGMLRSGDPVTLFQDVYYTPIHLEAQRTAIFDLIARGVSGVVNVVGDERLSKYAFGMKVADRFGLDESLIRAGRITEQVGLVRRPHDMSLSNGRARTLLGRSLGDVDAHLTLLKQQEEAGLAEELREL